MKKSHLFAAVAVTNMVFMILASYTAQGAKKKNPPPATVSSLFSLTATGLRTMVSDLPQPIQHTILSKPSEFFSSIAAILHRPAIHLILVDKQHRLPTGYEPRDLVHLSRYGLSVNHKPLELRKAIMPEVQAMVDAARADHVVLLFSSTYRSFQTQRFIYGREVRLYGKKVAARESAVPGHSQHQLGTTVDFGCICNDFANTTTFKWLEKHAGEYGFSMTYPKGLERVTGYRYEPWHWHYITTAGASTQREFFENIQQYLLLFINENQTLLVSSYRGANLGPGWNPGV